MRATRIRRPGKGTPQTLNTLNKMEPTTTQPQGSPASACSGVAVVDSDKVFGIKSPCPYCGGKITASANAWEEDDEGRFYATDLDISCSNEPDLDDEEAWKSWDIEHGRGDYNEAWHQLHERIVRSMKAKVRFNLQNTQLGN